MNSCLVGIILIDRAYEVDMFHFFSHRLGMQTNSPMSFVRNSKAWSTPVEYVGRTSRTAWHLYKLKHPGLHSTEPGI